MIRCLIILLLCLPRVLYAQDAPYLMTLGIAQDGGYPHMGCTKHCCNDAWKNSSIKRYVVSLALVDSVNKKWWLFEATPDIKEQLHYFNVLTGGRYNYLPDGIFITHAHIGHYTGLMQLGKEVMGANDVPVYALPKMKSFLEANGPWSQLVSQHNIELEPMQPGNGIYLSAIISVTPILVPHRDEYSETAGFKIHTARKNYLFIPDINKWKKWDKNIVEEVRSVDVALLDGTFYDSTELPGRNMSEVPHPFVMETMSLFDKADAVTRSKVYFIHLNHTNPLMWDERKQKGVRKEGFNIAWQGERL
jgi:pyrroloquinoline quinone biosynthesis protein B